MVVSLGGLFVLALALRESEALDTITVYQGVVIITGAVSNAMVLQEQRQNTMGFIVIYSISLLFILLGFAAIGLRDLAPSWVGRWLPPDSAVELPWYGSLAARMRRWTNTILLRANGTLPPSTEEGLEGAKAGGQERHSEATTLLQGR